MPNRDAVGDISRDGIHRDRFHSVQPASGPTSAHTSSRMRTRMTSATRSTSNRCWLASKIQRNDPSSLEASNSLKSNVGDGFRGRVGVPLQYPSPSIWCVAVPHVVRIPIGELTRTAVPLQLRGLIPTKAPNRPLKRPVVIIRYEGPETIWGGHSALVVPLVVNRHPHRTLHPIGLALNSKRIPIQGFIRYRSAVNKSPSTIQSRSLGRPHKRLM